MRARTLFVGFLLILLLVAGGLSGLIFYWVQEDKQSAQRDTPGLVFHQDDWAFHREYGVVIRYRVEGGDFSYAVWKLWPRHELRLWQ